jgi:hypothetical protein
MRPCQFSRCVWKIRISTIKGQHIKQIGLGKAAPQFSSQLFSQLGQKPHSILRMRIAILFMLFMLHNIAADVPVCFQKLFIDFQSGGGSHFKHQRLDFRRYLLIRLNFIILLSI